MNAFSALMIAEGKHDAPEHETVEAWAYLVSSGLAWNLGAHYASMAQSLIDRGVLDRNGTVLCACS